MVTESRDLVYYFHTRILPGNVHRINCNGWKARVLLQHIRNLLMGLEKSHSKKGRRRLLVNGAVWYTHADIVWRRLQTEILKLSDDESIFAWSSEDWRMDTYMHNGLLAPSPSLFAGCRFKPSREVDSEDFDETLWDLERPSYSMTNKGLKIKPLLMQGGHAHVDSLLSPVLSASLASLALKRMFIMPLNCRSPNSQLAPALCLMRIFTNEYARISNVMMLDCNSTEWRDQGLFQRRTLYIRQRY
jgi:hypothetical protein